jgi:hypothetical protein
MSVPVTGGQGDLAAASVANGTLVMVNNPATGANHALMQTDAGGNCTIAVTNTAAEKTTLVITADGCRPKVLELTFAA